MRLGRSGVYGLTLTILHSWNSKSITMAQWVFKRLSLDMKAISAK
jgi:hypothetical protein